MPVVLRERGFQVRIFLPAREHGPAHVHIAREGGEAVIVLNAPEQGVSVRDVHGMRPADVRQAVAVVETNADYLRQQWRKYHGE
jgi:uncharacterized protein DUF4160